MGKVQAAADDPEAVARIGEKPAGSLSPFLWRAVIKRASNDPKPGGPMFAGLIPAGPRVGRVGRPNSFSGTVSLLAPVLGSVMPEFTGGLLAPNCAAGPEYTRPGAVPPELFSLVPFQHSDY